MNASLGLLAGMRCPRYFILASLLSLAACAKGQPAHLALTLDGVRLSSDWQNATAGSGVPGSSVPVDLCVFPNDPQLASGDSHYCFYLVLSGELAKPTTLRVVGTNTAADSQPGVPSDVGPSFTLVPETGHSPEVLSASMFHSRSGAKWDGDQQQHVDGSLQIDHASSSGARGSIDVEVVGALPRADPDVVIDAHLSGTFDAHPPGQ